MSKTKTIGATALNLELPPEGGTLSVVTSLEEDAHYLRVTLDKAENFKVAAGERLNELLVNKFAGNRNALRDWYEEAVVQGKAHRAWGTVEPYLSAVRKYGSEAAAEIIAAREQHDRDSARERLTRHREDARAYREILGDSPETKNLNEINARNQHPRPVKSEYDLRKEWLSDMNVLWFKGEREWQDRWLLDRGLIRRPGY
jgi:hypothetical protein